MAWTFYDNNGTLLQGIADNAAATAKIADDAVTNVKVATGIDAVKLADGSVTNAEFQYINTLSSNAQSQITANAATAASKAAVGSGTPSTQTLPDTAATGSSTEAARLDHVHTMPAVAGVGLGMVLALGG